MLTTKLRFIIEIQKCRSVWVGHEGNLTPLISTVTSSSSFPRAVPQGAKSKELSATATSEFSQAFWDELIKHLQNTIQRELTGDAWGGDIFIHQRGVKWVWKRFLMQPQSVSLYEVNWLNIWMQRELVEKLIHVVLPLIWFQHCTDTKAVSDGGSAF